MATLDDARAALQRHFGYPAFRAGQERAVSAVLEGRDTLVVLPTGGGKSLCYQVPALLLPGLTVVVSPLISLMKDQVDALTARGLPAAFINSTLSSAEVSERLGRAQRGELKMLYVAPERFDAGGAAERLKAIGVSLLAVDEAHCISEWGHDFRPSYTRIGSVRERLGNPPTIALTATATPHVRRDVVEQLRLREAEIVITGFDRTNLRYHVVGVRSDDDKDRALVDTLRKIEGLTIVYASTRRAVERIAQMLSQSRVGGATAYHAGLDDARRHDVQEGFMREATRVIVATNAFGMGIDKPNVRLVVHHAMPGTLEAYYQEAGRAGRDGGMSDCVLLHAFRDRFTHEYFIKGANPDRDTVERVFRALLKSATQGLVAADHAALATLAGGGVTDRDVQSALRLLAAAGVVREEAPVSRLQVTLLATPARIKRELAGEDSLGERELLRALWRVAGDRLYAGALIDPDGLPPGFGGAQAVLGTLDRLSARQFVATSRGGGGLRLLTPDLPVRELPIDWRRLDRRRAAELAKLDAVQRYAYTESCRRAFVLRYFGDPAAKPKCEGCDRCVGSTLGPATAARAARGGRRKKKVDPAATAQTGAAADPVLLTELKALRARLARDDKVPAYVVYPDKTLSALAAAAPRSRDALKAVHGMGPSRIEKYGEQLLALIKRVTATA
jgi:ATP-dependent DNA helicase RecQ